MLLPISIHALLAESDVTARSVFEYDKNFYPRSPCGERHSSVNTADQEARFLSTLSLRRATVIQEIAVLTIAFLSTLSLRRATFSVFASPFSIFYFYPRSPCGERRVTVLGIQHRVGISIHALLAESDTCGDGQNE